MLIKSIKDNFTEERARSECMLTLSIFDNVKKVFAATSSETLP